MFYSHSRLMFQYEKKDTGVNICSNYVAGDIEVELDELALWRDGSPMNHWDD